MTFYTRETKECDWKVNDGRDSNGAGAVRPSPYQGGGGGGKDSEKGGRRSAKHFLCAGEKIRAGIRDWASE